MARATVIPDLKIFGIRNTRLVTTILEVLEQSHQPMEFKDLIGHVLMKIGHLDRASFYRAINRLQQKNLILEVSHNKFVSDIQKNSKTPRYLISCLSCHKTEKVKNPEFSKSVFTPQLSKLEVVTLSGICTDCEEEKQTLVTQHMEIQCN